LSGVLQKVLSLFECGVLFVDRVRFGLGVKWVANLLDELDKQVDEKTRVKILESCGRKCIGEGMLRKAEAVAKKSKSTEEFLEGLGKVWKHLSVGKDGVFVVYDRCYCPLVKGYEGELSASFCNCSVGWIKELFERSLKKSVRVEKLGTVKQGDKQCKFKITV
jgi:predicted hydrocarbon binding protein